MLFALRHLGVNSVTSRFLYFSKANKSGLVLHLPGLAGNPFLVVWWWGVLSLFFQNIRKPWELGNSTRFRGKFLILGPLQRNPCSGAANAILKESSHLPPSLFLPGDLTDTPQAHFSRKHHVLPRDTAQLSPIQCCSSLPSEIFKTLSLSQSQEET